MSPMIPKDQKIYNLHYDDVREDVVRPPHGTALNKLLMRSRGHLYHLTFVWAECNILPGLPYCKSKSSYKLVFHRLL